MSKHTPGPWVATMDPHRDFTIQPHGLTSAVAAVVNGEMMFLSGRFEQHIANARLITTAPDLLGELKDWARDSDGWSLEQLRKRYDEKTVQRILRTRAAIAKAEGESQWPCI